MSQSKLTSLIEVNTQVGTGFVVSLLAWRFIVPIVFPELAEHATWGTSGKVTLLIMSLMIVKAYIVRRAFNFYQDWRSSNGYL